MRGTARKPAQWLMAGVACFTVTILNGCGAGGDGPTRRAVSGVVTYDGQPVSHGTIRFLPQPEGPSVSLVISDGKFASDPRRGVPVGTCKVEVVALPNTAGISEDELLEKGAPPYTEVPAKYNTQSQLQTQIPAGSGFHEVEFALEK